MRYSFLLLCALCVLCENPSRAADPTTQPAPPAIISHIKILSNHVEDLSSLDAWQSATLKPNMTDPEKALAIWQSVVKFRHHDGPAPREYLTSDPSIFDALKLFNVYGYCTGTSAQAAYVQLARHAGLKARNLSVFRFGVPEVFYNNAWHMYDPGMINYFPKPDGSIASVDELVAAVKAWGKQNPGYHDDGKKLQAYLKDHGVKSGPALLANCPTLQPNGNYPFSAFGWYSTMFIYDTEKPPFIYEEPYAEGYQVNNQLRPGEKLTFNWSNQGLHINMFEEPGKNGKKPDPDSLTAIVGQKNLAYTPKLGDLANGRIGNGTLDYTPPLDSLKDIALTYDNLTVAGTTLGLNILRPADPTKPAILILDMPCSYVYLAGSLTVTGFALNDASINVDISDNNGLDWKPLPLHPDDKHPIDLQKSIFRRYDYRLKFTLTGNASIQSLKLTHTFQLSQGALPALDQGDNTLTFSAGGGGNESTLTIEPAPPKYQDKQLTNKDFHALLSHLTEDDTGTLTPDATGDTNPATITFPLETPGPLTRLRLGCDYRSKSETNCWLYQVSFDDGKSFQSIVHTPTFNTPDAYWITFNQIPPNTHKALIRFQAQSNQPTLQLFHLRIDADYTPPNSTTFSPIAITYTWQENELEKHHTHTPQSPAETYKITCPLKPTLKSLTLERAP